MVSVGIKTLNYLGLMVNQCDGNHHNDNDEVEDVVLTKVEFRKFCEETQQDMLKIQQLIATLLSRKSSNRIATLINIFKDTLLNIIKFHSLMERCVS